MTSTENPDVLINEGLNLIVKAYEKKSELLQLEIVKLAEELESKSEEVTILILFCTCRLLNTKKFWLKRINT